MKVTSRRPLNGKSSSDNLGSKVTHQNIGASNRPENIVAHESDSLHSLQLGSTVPESYNLHARSTAYTQQSENRKGYRTPGMRRIMGEEDNDPDDTQPLSQSVYETFVSKSKSINGGEKEDESGQQDTQAFSVREQESGHVDLLSSFKPVDHAQEDEEDQDVDVTSDIYNFSPTQTQAPLPRISDSPRFKTPGTVGKKRDFLGRTIERTPINSNPFASATKTAGGVMGLSQLFQTTQAISSPLADTVSDPSDRPTPGMDLNGRPITATSPLSPIKERSPIKSRTGLQRSVTEPSAHYISMQLSQAQRQRLAKDEGQDGEEGSDDSLDESSLVIQQNRQRELDRRIKEQFQNLNRQHCTPDVDVRRYQNGGKTVGLEISEAGQASSPRHLTDNETEEETDQEEVPLLSPRRMTARTNSDEDKENIDVPIQVPRTSAKLQATLRASDSSPLSSRPHLAQRHTYDSLASFAVADSQRSHPENEGSIEHTRHMSNQVTSSAGDMVIPQSQVADRDAIPTSSPQIIRVSRSGMDSIRQHTNSVSGQRSEPRANAESGGPHLKRHEIGNMIAETNRTMRLESHVASHSQKESSTISENRNVSNDQSHGSSKYQTAASERPPASSPRSPNLPQILSSPSGRQQRRMVDIGLDPSPHDFTADIDSDFGIVTVDDEQFKQIVGDSSPIAPGRRPKRLRRNSVAARISSPPRSSIASEDAVMAQAEVPQTAPVLASTARRKVNKLRQAQSGITSNTTNVWDIIDSPPKRDAISLRARATPNEDDSDGSGQDPASTPAQGITSETNKDPNEVKVHLQEALSTNKPILEAYNGDASFPSLSRPNQIFACFNGTSRAYYPAKCLSVVTSDPLRYEIQWEGYEPDEVDAHGVKRLELKVGDSVKVNKAGVPKISYIIKGFKPQVSEAAKEIVTDVFGHDTIIVAAKQRKSLPADINSDATFEVKVADIYLDSNMWAQFKDRYFSFPKLQRSNTPSFATPVEATGTPKTPPSRIRRDKASLATIDERDDDGLFSGMVFAISVDETGKKTAWANYIRINGGVLLEEGFEEIFESSSTSLTTPTKAKVAEETPDSTDLRLKFMFRDSKFTALVTDDVSRKPKYMQALALGIPCIHGSWVVTCATQNNVVSWRPFLLAAGKSKLLDGAMRSRILPAIDSSNANLESLITARPSPFAGESVIFVAGKSKTEEKRKPFIFLLRAMGARCITRVHDIKAANAIYIDDPTMTYVVVDDKEVATTKALFQSSKRKRTSTGRDNNAPRVIGTDFIAQSIILGQLFDE
ncbi:putative dna damage repair protein [Phaeomoniella chlamydospora]|uniref:Putative dna damage repair protein n=1 Tax=Phaeomoniella chlamydospora TaxID=158046 RepID=A0A0G2E0C8_PHACM|nr:putative dna damage repair protein [Phaeomoniella chlamydospora]